MSVPRNKVSAANLAALINKSAKVGRYKVSPKEARTYEGIVFDSKWEAETYKLLSTLLPKDVKIHRQVNFLLQEKFKAPNGKGIREINYLADFLITREEELQDNIIPADAFVIDSKGHLTDIFKLKNKMFMYKYRALIHQVKSAKDVAAVVEQYKAQ
ncbi:MAG: DUF1064 domain-containing protein [Bacteroidota bacterium]|jgi:hypothetical protein